MKYFKTFLKCQYKCKKKYLLVQRMIISLNFDAHVRNISSLNASIVTTFTIGIALELPADLLVVWSLDFFGRRWSTAGSMILSSIATFLCAIFLGKLSSYKSIRTTEKHPGPKDITSVRVILLNLGHSYI